jgi:spore germination protein YaaH
VGKTQNYGGILDQLIFLGVEVDKEGSLVWDNQSKKIDDDSYLKLKSQVKKNILGIKLFDSDLIDKLVASGSARQTLINESKAIKQVARFDGINVDFEYMGDPNRVLQDDFISFMDEYKQEVGGEISLDVFANTVIKGDTVQLNKLMGVIDKLIIMAYDFHQTSSDFVGPVAPIGSPVGERNINEVAQKIVEAGLPKNKVIMAYPLYGYQWRTVDQTYGSQVAENWGRMVSYSEAKERMETGVYEKFTDFKYNWDEVSLTPWVSFKNEETTEKSVRSYNKKTRRYYWSKVTVPITRIYQAYFENIESLRAKMELAKQTQVGGVGFWALGYEGDDGELWKMVVEKSQL